MRIAWRASVEPIVASGLTVILGLLCLLLSDLASISGLGPVGAFGIAGAMTTSLFFLPLVLVLLGRTAYWPVRPRFGSEHTDTRGLWGKLARLISRRAFGVWTITGATLLTLASMSLLLNEDPVPQTDIFLTEVESVKAQDLTNLHFSSDSSSPLQIVVPESKLAETKRLIQDYPGISKTGSNAFVPAVYAIPRIRRI